MSQPVKTIFMARAQSQSWLQHLRAGVIKQGKGRLIRDDGSMCCLGVLQHAISARIEEGAILPSSVWLSANHIRFVDAYGQDSDCPALFFNGHLIAAWKLNDLCKLNFNEIADLIEKHTEFTDETTN